MKDNRTVSIAGLKQLLVSKGIKPSYQRLKILEYIIKNKNHPSVDTIYRVLQKKIPTLSRTTIYNTLTLFAGKGIVNTLTIVDNELRFDLAQDNHAHFYCTRCKRLYDVELASKQFARDLAAGHQVNETHIYFKGTCKSCLKSNNAKKPNEKNV